MFKKTTLKEVYEDLKARCHEYTTIHYICDECSDEQVTGFIEVNEDMTSTMNKEGYILTNLPCTNCSVSTKFLEKEQIIGFEDE